MANLSPAKLLDILTAKPARANEAGEQAVLSTIEELPDVLRDLSLSTLDVEKFKQSSQHILRELKMAPGESALVVNGRVRANSIHIGYVTDGHGCS